MKANKRKKTSLEKFGLILLAVYLFGFFLGVAAANYSGDIGRMGVILFIAAFIFTIVILFNHFIDIYNTLTDNP